MSYEIILDTITTIFTDVVNSLFSSGVLPDSVKYVIVQHLLKTGKKR